MNNQNNNLNKTCACGEDYTTYEIGGDIASYEASPDVCEDCLNALADEKWSDEIGDYHDSHNDALIFIHKGAETRSEACHIGFELEVDMDDNDDVEDDLDHDTVSMLTRRLGARQTFSFEEDGSLNHGFECISKPISAEVVRSEDFQNYIKEFVSALREYGWRSHDVGTCGLHVHIDRKFFGDVEGSALTKLLYIFSKYKDNLLRFSRRHSREAARWAASYDSDLEEYGSLKEIVMEQKHSRGNFTRYRAVNVTNARTIEIRLWRGSLNSTTVLATLLFSIRLAELVKETPTVQLAKMSWEEILGDDAIINKYWDTVKNRNI